VQRHPFQHLSILLLLIARLVLGELAHAVPQQNESTTGDTPAAAHSEEVPCPDHAASKSDAPEVLTDRGEATAKPHGAESHDTNCCENACDCACLHLSALTMPATVSVAALDELLVGAAALGHTPDRIFLLFRPPA
jgi:hypothetical protein